MGLERPELDDDNNVRGIALRAAQLRWHSDDLAILLQRAMRECDELQHQQRTDPQARQAAALERQADAMDAIRARLADDGRPPLARLQAAADQLRGPLPEVAAWLDKLARP